MTIKLIVADIDGCFTAGGRSDINLHMLAKVAEYNQRAITEPQIPHLVFNTGRPLPYIQALQQAIASRLPSIAEFGAVFWCPETQTHAIHPAYTAEHRRKYEEIVLQAEEEFTHEGSGVLIEAGKVCQLTLYPRIGVTMEDVIEETNPFVARHSEYFTVDVTTHVLNFLPHGVNKGTALDWLSEQTGFQLNEMAGIGDSDCDWRFLERCAISATPPNGSALLQERCRWHLAQQPGNCILELYERIFEYNQSS
ncbi:MAG: HAD family hydrolase [Sumerlaeia bacterium]